MLKSWTPPATGMLSTLRRGVLVASINKPYPQNIHIEGREKLVSALSNRKNSDHALI
jgi:hypothetical protein